MIGKLGQVDKVSHLEEEKCWSGLCQILADGKIILGEVRSPDSSRNGAGIQPGPLCDGGTKGGRLSRILEDAEVRDWK